MEDYNEFTTKNGRKVYDGGGILPDVKLKTSEYSQITQALLQQDAIFDFATKYYYSHTLDNPDNFNFSDQDFASFKSYLQTIDFDYKTTTEKEFNEMMEAAKEENINLKNTVEIKGLEQQFDNLKSVELDSKKAEITSLLINEIIKRYFYKEGLYEFYTEKNPEIIKAKSILNSPKEYTSILK